MMHLLSSDDLSRDSINRIFEIADEIKEGKQEASLKEHSTLTLYFEKPSTRTRLSFEAAITQLGGNAFYIDPETTQVSRGETIEDTVRMLSLYSDFIAARLYRHSDLVEMAKYSSVPMINALTDLEHPTQALADVYTIRSRMNLKRTRIAFLGDVSANTANSLMLTAAKLGAEIMLIGPKSIPPNSKYVTKAMGYSKIMVKDSVEYGLEGADVVYTDTYVSMGEESEAAKRKKLLAPYQLNKTALSFAKPKAVVMHCLMAHRGEEITSEVLDGPQSIVMEQAGNKLLINKAILIFLAEKG